MVPGAQSRTCCRKQLPSHLRPPTRTEKGEEEDKNEGYGWKGFGGQDTPKLQGQPRNNSQKQH